MIEKFVLNNNLDEKNNTVNENKSLIGFFFSKYNEKALQSLGYDSYSQAFKDLSIRLSGNENAYIKQRRDEFDVFFPENGRVGYKNRKPAKMVKAYYEKWNNISFEDMTSMIKKMINNPHTIYGVNASQKFNISDFSNSKDCDRYINSLLAKPFVILTGNSGTGKTRIAVKLAKHLKSYVPVFNKDLHGLFQYILNNDIDIDGIRLASVSESSIEVFNTNNKKINISFGIIQEYVDWYNENGLDADPERTTMQDNGSFDRQSYSWDRPQIQSIAKYVCNYRQNFVIDICEENCLLVPVGADWTDNTKILGYYNPLANKGKGKYEKTNVLEFIELAAANPTIPFFLILDEMNLSHVERYFSDFLSKMELVDYEKNEKVFFDIVGYGKLELPKNLFITGTVNIDETTYMFSPKVLDRANVIEFKPTKESIISSFKDSSADGDTEISMGNARDFLQLAEDVRKNAPSEEVSSILDGVAPILEKFYDELEKFGFEFAYRTVKEIRLYAIAAYKTAEGNKPTVTDIADVQILQKILPKIHGNKKQIGELLKNLTELCGNNLPRSKAKIEQMQEKLNRFQYASFI